MMALKNAYMNSKCKFAPSITFETYKNTKKTSSYEKLINNWPIKTNSKPNLDGYIQWCDKY